MAERTVTLKLNTRLGDSSALRDLAKDTAKAQKNTEGSAAASERFKKAMADVTAEMDKQQKKSAPQLQRLHDVLPANRVSKALEATGKESAAAAKGNSVEGAGASFGALAAGIGTATAAVGAGIVAFQKLASEVQSFVSKANPGAITRFDMAMEDTLAVIGHALTPLIEGWTKELRLLGDFLASILPTSAEVREALGGSFDVMDQLREVAAEVAPVIKELIKVGLKGVAVAASAAAKALRYVIDGLKELGIIKGGGTLTSSKDAAARPVSLTDTVSYAKSIYTAIGSGAGKEPQERTATNTAAILDNLKTLPAEIATALAKVVLNVSIIEKAKQVGSAAGRGAAAIARQTRSYQVGDLPTGEYSSRLSLPQHADALWARRGWLGIPH